MSVVSWSSHEDWRQRAAGPSEEGYAVMSLWKRILITIMVLATAAALALIVYGQIGGPVRAFPIALLVLIAAAYIGGLVYTWRQHLKRLRSETAAPGPETTTPPEQAFELTYEVTLDDLVAIQLATYRPQAVRNTLLYLYMYGMILLLFLSGLSGELRTTSFASLMSLTGVSLLGLIVWLTVPFAQYRGVRKWFVRTQRTGVLPSLGQHTVTLSSTGLRDQQTFLDATYVWHTAIRVAEEKNYVFVHVNSLAYLPIPRRAFPDAEGYARFMDLLKRYAGAGTSIPRKPPT